MLDPNSWVEFFILFLPVKEAPERFTLKKFTSQNSPSKIQPRNRAEKFTLHLCRAIWLKKGHLFPLLDLCSPLRYHRFPLREHPFPLQSLLSVGRGQEPLTVRVPQGVPEKIGPPARLTYKCMHRCVLGSGEAAFTSPVDDPVYLHSTRSSCWLGFELSTWKADAVSSWSDGLKGPILDDRGGGSQEG